MTHPYPRPPLPSGAHLALCLSQAPPDVVDELIRYLDEEIREPETHPDLRQILSAIALDAMAGRYDLDDRGDATLDAMLSEAPDAGQ